MENKYEINDMIDKYIEKLANSGLVVSFYPNAINKALNVPLSPVLEKLNSLVKEDKLVLKFEIRCHDGSHIVDILNDYGKYLGKEIYCQFCGDDIYIDIENISPIYYIDDNYKDYVKKKIELRDMNNQVYQIRHSLVMA